MEQKVILITGGSDGLGKTIAQYLKDKHKVVILSSNQQKLQAAAEQLNVDWVVCDVASCEQVTKAVDYVVQKYNKIDVLINNAGLQIQGPLDESDYDRIDKVINVNLTGVINLTKATLPCMKANKSGLIININSQAGLYHKAERTVYHASKWGVTGFTKCLSAEVAQYGIKVTDLLPGKMKTNTFANMGIVKSMDDAVDTIQVAKVIDFIIDLPQDVTIPEIGIKHIDN